MKKAKKYLFTVHHQLQEHHQQLLHTYVYIFKNKIGKNLMKLHNL